MKKYYNIKYCFMAFKWPDCNYFNWVFPPTSWGLEHLNILYCIVWINSRQNKNEQKNIWIFRLSALKEGIIKGGRWFYVFWWDDDLLHLLLRLLILLIVSFIRRKCIVKCQAFKYKLMKTLLPEVIKQKMETFYLWTGREL